ncbi:hypothetical protein Tco_0478903 [Tanacetum coccineum]
MSTAEAEYVSLSACCAQVIWIRTQLLDYGYKYDQIPMYCNSKSAIAISCNPVQHLCTKHIDIQYHFIKEHVEKATVELYFVGTEYQLADLFTKALPKERFEYLVHRIVIIMAQQQNQSAVHQEELCPPNKRYALMDTNKNVDLEHVLCSPESKNLMNIIQNHPLRFSIAASSLVPWIYMAQFWHTLKEDRSKYRLKSMLNRKELTLTLDDFRTIFHLPQANDNNHDQFVPSPKFFDMVPFYKNELGFTMEPKTSSSFKTTCLLQPWQTLDVLKMLDNSCNWMGSTTIADYADDVLQSGNEDSNLDDHRRDKVHSALSDVCEGESSAPRSSTVIRLRIPQRRFSRLTPPAPVLTVDETDNIILQETLQVSLVEENSHKELKAQQNVELVKEHLAVEEIEKLVEGTNNVNEDSSNPKNDDDQNIPSTRLEPRSDKEGLEVKITAEVQPVNVYEEDEELADDVYELKRREKGKHVEEYRSTPSTSPIRSPRSHTNLVSSDTEKLQELTVTDPNPSSSTPSSCSPISKISSSNHLWSLLKIKPRCFKHYKSFFHEIQERYGYLFEHLKTKFMPKRSFDKLADHLQDVMFEALPKMVDDHIKEQVKGQVPIYVTEGLILERQKNQAEMARDHDDPHDDAHLEGKNSAKRQKTTKYQAYMTGESSSSKLMKANKVHHRQMKNFLKSDIVWERKKEILVSPHLRKATPLVQSCQRDPEAPALSLVNQDLLYLKKGSLGPEKSVMSLYKFPAVIFNDDDIEERTFRWVNKCVKKFNPYARYGVEHWKNSHAKIFYIRK